MLLARYTSGTTQLTAALPVSVFAVKVKDTLALNAKLGFDLTPNVTLAVAGENLTDAAGAEIGPVAAERQLRASLQFRF